VRECVVCGSARVDGCVDAWVRGRRGDGIDERPGSEVLGKRVDRTWQVWVSGVKVKSLFLIGARVVGYIIPRSSIHLAAPIPNSKRLSCPRLTHIYTRYLNTPPNIPTSQHVSPFPIYPPSPPSHPPSPLGQSSPLDPHRPCRRPCLCPRDWSVTFPLPAPATRARDPRPYLTFRLLFRRGKHHHPLPLLPLLRRPPPLRHHRMAPRPGPVAV
jgi:hypothetical protein